MEDEKQREAQADTKTLHGHNPTRVVGGGASLEPTRLCHQFPVSGKSTGKIPPRARPVGFEFGGTPYPERLPTNSAECAPSQEQGINRELWPAD